MSRDISRRSVVLGLSASAALPLLSSCASNRRSDRPPSIFSHGVASGDPDHHSVVLWTRVNSDAPAVTGQWELATDSGFIKLVDSGEFTTTVQRDMTVKIVPEKLPSGTTYFYRFRVGSTLSPVGRTRTLPDGRLEKLGIAVASCSNYPFGYFNAYEAIALDPSVDVVLHLGDYIYEYGSNGYGGATGRTIGRDHAPSHETTSLNDYRQRHAQYKADPQSRAMHAAHPLIVLWDDHESANNPWMQGAENHQGESEGDWTTRRRESLQAYYEWMPVREPGPTGSREEYWRHYRFGDLASLVTLETRHSGRARQIEYSDYADQITTRKDAQDFLREVVGAPGRNMLSPEMEDFVSEALQESLEADRPWRLIGNQIPMARTHCPELPARYFDAMNKDPSNPIAQDIARFRRQGELDVPLYLDPWDGYPWAREKFYDLCRKTGAEDLLVLTGDSHSFWQNQLFDANNNPMGLELGTTGITSPGDFLNLGTEGAMVMDEELANHNREVLWTEGRTNGYIRLVLSRKIATVDYVGVSQISSRDYLPLHIRSLRIERDSGHLKYT